MSHPLALGMGIHNKFQDIDGNWLGCGDKFIYILDQRTGTINEVLQDGECLVTLDNGEYANLNWNLMVKG